MNDKKEKLRKLLNLAKGTANEAEALAAMEKALAYADMYGLSLDDIRSESDESKQYRSSKVWSGTRDYHPVDKFLAKTISVFTGTVLGDIHTDADGDIMLSFFGHDADVDLAIWLRDTIRQAMDTDWGVYRDFVWRKQRGESVVSVKLSFMQAMSVRLKERMTVLKEKHEASPTGRELVVVKNALLIQRIQEHGFNPAAYTRGRNYDTHAGAKAAGYSAGGRVNIGRGVTGSSARQITKQ